jgi:ADP-ribosylation factor GTPase-activating protein 1
VINLNESLFSEGGRYAGFGYTMEPQNKGTGNNSNEVLDQAMNSLSKGWSMFSLAATKIASSAGENAVKFGEIASQKAVELSGSVSEKVRKEFTVSPIFIFGNDEYLPTLVESK